MELLRRWGPMNKLKKQRPFTIMACQESVECVNVVLSSCFIGNLFSHVAKYLDLMNVTPQTTRNIPVELSEHNFPASNSHFTQLTRHQSNITIYKTNKPYLPSVELLIMCGIMDCQGEIKLYSMWFPCCSVFVEHDMLTLTSLKWFYCNLLI